MPQCKLHFLGAQGLDPRMPRVLKEKIEEEEWNQFVLDINSAIRQAQSTMGLSPWFIVTMATICIILVIIDIAVGGDIFGTAGIMLSTAITLCGVAAVCYACLVKPTTTLEEMVEVICEDYSDEENEIYFLYRHHANVGVMENRFYLEVFIPENAEEEMSRALVAIKEDPAEEESRALVTLVPPEQSRALVLAAPPSRALVPASTPNLSLQSGSQALTPVDNSRSLIPLNVERTELALVALNSYTQQQAHVPRPQTPAPAPMPYVSGAIVPTCSSVFTAINARTPVVAHMPRTAMAPAPSPVPLSVMVPHAAAPSNTWTTAPVSSQNIMPAQAPVPLPAPLPYGLSATTPHSSMQPMARPMGSPAVAAPVPSQSWRNFSRDQHEHQPTRSS
ncbi:expressed unknown protein [Seminavis robusta]|uniref:Uncharacterized protein n=1 Tax=Seminavis robusta TaxID=568900 RepID=A0A9N8EQH6_9STRA|nr:expressed unknown protein [Seminavis robusta]|eukprot:Sro1441_g272960.1 n/a (391) ;mRNA; f:19189-20361